MTFTWKQDALFAGILISLVAPWLLMLYRLPRLEPPADAETQVEILDLELATPDATPDAGAD